MPLKISAAHTPITKIYNVDTAPKFKTLSRDIWIKTIGASPKIAVKIAAMNVNASKPLKRYSSGINQVQSKIRSWDAMPVSLEIR